MAINTRFTIILWLIIIHLCIISSKICILKILGKLFLMVDSDECLVSEVRNYII